MPRRLVILLLAVYGLGIVLLYPQAGAETVRASIDEARAAAAGIRKLASRHLVLYTDLPSGPQIDSLPALFDKAVPLWAVYFGVEPAATADWHVQGFLIGDREKFAVLGLLPPDNALMHGYAKGDEIWLSDQPTDYYRRHLLLHEGTHAFMTKFLGGTGPGWYSEGMAELLGTHRLEAGNGEQRAGSRLMLGIMPRDRREVPMLGRIKLVRDAVAANHPLSLPDVMAIENHQQLGNDSYAWCWAAAKFLDSHPRYRDRFRALEKHVQDPNFNDLVNGEFAADWDQLLAEWQAYAATLDYGYDFERMAIRFERGTPLGGKPRTGTVAADRGWQSSGVWLEAGKRYHLTARGRYQIAEESVAGVEKAWPCEPGGVTIEYYDRRPLGMLLGALVPDGAGGGAGFARPIGIGLEAAITPEASGTLYLRVNDAAGRLGDNRGALTIIVED